MNKKWMTTLSRALCVVTGLLVPIIGIAASGRTAGAASVGSGGGASYSIPLNVPLGTHGMTPSLSLSYSSATDNGLIGVGWSIGGLSSIRRCGRTWAQDGEPRDIRRDYSDRFCLNGSKLRLTSGSYGYPNATYQTEIADFSTVTSLGSAGNGPESFRVQDRAGTIYEYGNTADSRIEVVGFTEARVWALNRVVDTAGNAMSFTYTKDTTNGSYRIARVNYTSNVAQGLAAAYEVEFVYETRPSSEIDTYYVAGGRVREITRLDRIDMRYNASVVRRYELTYESLLSSTSKSRLASIQECAGSPLDCFPATTFLYQNGTLGLGAEVAAASIPSGNPAWPLDVNGDGRSDIVYSSSVISGAGYWMYMRANSAGGYDSAVSTGIVNTNFLGATPIDYNADGLEDLLVPYAGGTWWVLLGTTGPNGLAAPADTGAPAIGTGRNARALDIDGDGLQDLVWGDVNGYSGGAIEYRLRVAGQAFSSTVTTLAAYGVDYQINDGIFEDGQARARRNPDFNGDGRDDLIFRWSSRRWIPNSDTGGIWRYTYSYTVMCPGGWNLTFTTSAAASKPQFGDFNGDGKSDLFYYDQSGTIYVKYSTGLGFTAAVTVGSLTYLNWTMFDWDGDGYEDLLFQNAAGDWSLRRSTGVDFSPATATGLAGGGQVTVSDINGDGLSDLAGSVGGSYRYRLHAGVMPDLLQTATDGLGNYVTFNYASLTNANYSKYADATFPEQDYIGSTYVVNSVTASDGIGGSFTNSFWYYGARVHLQGRGFEGFNAKRTTDSRNGLYNYQYYRRDFPFTGMVYQDDLYQSNAATLIRRQQNHPTYMTLDATASNQRYFPYVYSATGQTYEVGGGKNGQLITTTGTTYTYDTSGNATNISSTVTDNDSGSPYSGQQWASTATSTISPQPGCLGLPTQVSVTSSAPGVPSLTRTTSFTPNYTYCRMSQVVVEPSSSTYRVTRDLFYDGFGNVNSEIVTGVGMAARTTGTSWGATGQFPVSVTNALNQTSLMGYDYGLGVNTSMTDANNLTVTFGYDGFGRRTSEIRPDGTSATTSYTTCSAGSCLNSNHRITATRTEYNVGGSILTDQFTYLDSFERPIAASQRLLSGAYNLIQTRYDSLGRVSQQSVPCAAASCSGYWASNYYDALNRVTLQQRPVSASNPTLQSTIVAYLGRTTSVTDPEKGSVTTKVTTVAGTLGRSLDHNGYYQSFGYDALGSLLSVTDSQSNALFSATYDYGAAAFQRTLSDMDLGTRVRTYNALGEVVSGSDGKGQSFSATFDLLSRPLTRLEAEGTTQWTWGSTAANYTVGKLQSVSSPGYVESYTYDNQGRPSARQIVTDASYAYNYTYSSTTGLLDTMTYPVSTSSYRLQLQYVYQNGVLRQVRDSSAGTVFWQADATNFSGQVTQETLGNGVVTNRAFDAVTGWVSTIQSGVGGGAGLQNESYLFDRLGNVTQRQNNNLGLTENFYYDNLYRLDYSALNGGTNLDMAYDAMGNITSRSDIAGGATWTYHATKRHAVTQAGSSSYTYSYDANGNAQTRNGHSISWTSYNYPSVINGPGKALTFSYGPDRQRYRQVYNNGSTTETTQYIGGMLEKVTIGGTTDWRHYVSAGGTTVAVVSRLSTGTNTTRYLLEDHQGSIAQITDSGGVAYVSESFTAFGARRDAASWAGACNCNDLAKMKSVTRRGYTGHEAIGGASMGLTHMNGRVQDAITGRFLSPDPFTTDAGNTQGWNRYSYVLNNPLSAVDPSGFETQSERSERRDAWFAENGGVSPEQEATFMRGQQLWHQYWGPAMASAGMAPMSAMGLSGQGWFQFTSMGGFRGPSGQIGAQRAGQWQYVRNSQVDISDPKTGELHNQGNGRRDGYWELSNSTVDGTGNVWGPLTSAGPSNHYACAKVGACGNRGYVSPQTAFLETAIVGGIVGGGILLSDPLIASLFGLASAPTAISDGMPPGFNVVAGGGAKLANLGFSDALRIQNAVNRTGTTITVVGSRASGRTGAFSDWDYVLPAGTPSRVRHSLSSSLPEGPHGLGEPRLQDFFIGPVDTSLPYVTFSPIGR